MDNLHCKPMQIVWVSVRCMLLRQIKAMSEAVAEWRSWVADKGIAVKDADRHFLSFCRNRGPYDEQRSSLRS